MPMLSVAQSHPSERAEFIRKTYIHLAGAIAAFTLLEVIFFNTGIAQLLASLIFASGGIGWLAIMGGFTLIGWLSSGLASKANNEGLQYLGLGLYVLIYSIVFIPLLFVATQYADSSVLPTAVVLTLCMFAGLTLIAFTTQKDFSFLGGFLRIGGFVSLGFIVCSVIFGFQLGLLFSLGMVLFASVAILYDTSNVMRHYATNQHVAAALKLFGSVAMLFYYILQILIRMNRR